MAGEGGGGKGKGLRIFRRCVQAAFLAFFVVLAFKAAYPPLSTPPSNLFLRFDPLSGLFSLLAARSASAFVRYWPALILLGLTLVSGRFFCGWICPLGTCFDAVGAVKPKALEYYRPKGKRMKELLDRSRAGENPRRVRVKYLLLALVLILSLAGVNLLYFASPLVLLNRSIYLILLPQVPVVLILLLLLALSYRPRFWCEELCPLGALFSLVSMAGKRLAPRFSPLSVVKDAGACIECGACYRECPFGVEEPFTKRDNGRLRSADCSVCGVCVAACPATGALSLDSFGATMYGLKGKETRGRRTAVTPEIELPATDGKNRRLDVSRGEFMASMGLGAVLLAGYGLGVRAYEEPVLRMPGAQDEGRFLVECNRCLECARACPTGCLRPMGLEDGFQKLATPRFLPRKACCQYDLCKQACSRACPAGAIEPTKPEEVRIGTASINRRRCRSWNGQICLICDERCRFDAIDPDERGRPHVDEEKCTGCGACEQLCPTEPASIKVYPTAWRGTGQEEEGQGRGGRRR